MFNGPISERECRINLDVAFEDNPYPRVLKREVTTSFIKTSGKKTYVEIPTHESILGDKLTAFAPNTIGVNPFMTSLEKETDNRLQVMKQFYDIARLYDYVGDIKEVLVSYKTCQNFENIFRNTKYSIKETLLDAFNHAAEIASMGLWNKNSSFYKDIARAGTQGLETNLFDGKYNSVLAANDAAKVMHLCTCLLTSSELSSNESALFKGKELQCFKAIQDLKTFTLIRNSLGLLHKAKLI